MRTTQLLATIATLLLTSQVAIACSCAAPHGSPEKEQIESAFAEADAVIVAKVISTKQSLRTEDPSGRYRVEDALFAILEVLKGNHRIGETIRVQSMLGSGSCGRSARNDPPWLETTGDSSSASGPAVTTTAVFSEEWLIYAYGQEPYELSSCSRSFPMNLRGGADAEYIRTMALGSGEEHGI